jgi:RecG-like helicase
MVFEMKNIFGTPKGYAEASQATTATPNPRRTSRSTSSIVTTSISDQTPPSRKVSTTKLQAQTKTTKRKKSITKHKETRKNFTLVIVDDEGDR